MKLSDFLDQNLVLIEQQLALLIPPSEAPYQQLFDAACYSISGKGKRIRPLLALTLCHMLGGDKKAALVPACSLELIHTYSLIHDDLPCMDNDDYRRGKPTLHKAYNDPLALLAGDYLLTYAFEVISTANNLSDKQKVQLTRILSQRSGAHGMIGGQVMDIESSHKAVNLDTLKLLHQLKTGALITAAVEFGGILGGADDVQMNILQQFGQEIGLAFQINDDIHDVTQSHIKHGKAIASDVINNKTTYVTLLGIEKSQQTAQALLTSAIGYLKTLSVDTSLMEEFAKLIIYKNS